MSATVISTCDPGFYDLALADAARALRAGKLVIFPTETVYGLAANAADPQAMARLRSAKNRPTAAPFTVHIGQAHHAASYVTAPSPLARRLMRRAWPGPLTVICEEPNPAQTRIAAACPAAQLGELYHDGLVGLRCPDHPAAARLLGDPEVPIVATSANRHGAAPPHDAQAALHELGEFVDYAIDAGPTRHNSPSTIVEVRGHTWKVVREGALDRRTIERLAVTEILFVCTGNSCRSLMAEHLFRRELARRLGLPIAELREAGYRIVSAGTSALLGAPASPGATDEMARRGIDVSSHRAQPLTVELIHRAQRIYVMSPEHRAAVLDLVPGASGRVQLLDETAAVVDPMGGTAEDYRRCAEHIAAALGRRLEEFLDEDRHWQ